MENLKIFMAKFPKFDIKYTVFLRKKKKKTGKIQNEQSVAVNLGAWKIYTVVLYDSNTNRFCDS